MINEEKIQKDVVARIVETISQPWHPDKKKWWFYFLDIKSVNQETIDYLFMFGWILSVDPDGPSLEPGSILENINDCF
jgi:hypothetical protein